MGRQATLLEGLCGHALSFGAEGLLVEYKDGREWVFMNKGGSGIGIANYASSGADAKELRENLHAAGKKPVKTAIGGQVWIIKVRVYQSFGDSYEVTMTPAPKLDPSISPPFTKKRASIWRSFITTHRSIAGLRRNWISSATFELPLLRFTR